MKTQEIRNRISKEHTDGIAGVMEQKREGKINDEHAEGMIKYYTETWVRRSKALDFLEEEGYRGSVPGFIWEDIDADIYSDTNDDEIREIVKKAAKDTWERLEDLDLGHDINTALSLLDRGIREHGAFTEDENRALRSVLFSIIADNLTTYDLPDGLF